MAEEEEYKEPPFRYVQMSDGGEHHVFVVHEDTPSWFRLVATFTNKKRAEGYTEVENDIAEDGDIRENWHDADMGPAPATLPEAPASVIGPQLLARGQTTVRVAAEVRYDDRTERRAPADVVLEAPRAVSISHTPAETVSAPPRSIAQIVSDELPGNHHLNPATHNAIVAGLVAGGSVREVMQMTGAAKGTIQIRRDILVRLGHLQSREEMDGKDLTRKDEPEIDDVDDQPSEPATKSEVSEEIGKLEPARAAKAPPWEARKPPVKGAITIEDVIAELKETGHNLTHDDRREFFKVDGATKRLTRDEIFALANRVRLSCGRPMWDKQKVGW